MSSLLETSIRSVSLVAVVLGSACATTPRSAPPPTLQVEVHAADVSNGRVNSYLITGRDKAVLVDAQLVASEARELVEMIRASGKELETIFVTHAHPDHFMGLSIVAAAFPEARIVARPSVAEAIPAAYEEFEPLLQRFFPGDVPKGLVVPEVLAGTSLELEGVTLEVRDFEHGESEITSALLVPSLDAVFCADMAYNRVHPWLNELRFDGVREHVSVLESMGVATIYPGHGTAMTVADLATYRAYVDEFLEVAEEAPDAKTIVDTMSARHADYETLAGLRFSATAYVSNREAAAAGGSTPASATP